MSERGEDSSPLDLFPLCPCGFAQPANACAGPAKTGERACLAPVFRHRGGAWVECTEGHVFPYHTPDRHHAHPDLLAVIAETRAQERRGIVLARGMLAGWRPRPKAAAAVRS